MACPICTHTMHKIETRMTDLLIFWCPRCGCVKEQDETKETFSVPKLAGRCRDMLARAVIGNRKGYQEVPGHDVIAVAESIGAQIHPDWRL